ncbi:hypothetical protein LEA_02922 [human gut metagenome]|uniref:Uncharacterized protein n=1 Tax=human gut metagenome TaxID=408170 RepID=K1U131_9ZZZZ
MKFSQPERALNSRTRTNFRSESRRQADYICRYRCSCEPDGQDNFHKLQLPRLKDEDPGTEDPEPKPEQIDITFSTGELLYLPNGMLLINLFETDNTSVYQTQIKLEGIENNGA